MRITQPPEIAKPSSPQLLEEDGHINLSGEVGFNDGFWVGLVRVNREREVVSCARKLVAVRRPFDRIRVLQPLKSPGKGFLVQSQPSPQTLKREMRVLFAGEQLQHFQLTVVQVEFLEIRLRGNS
jgi:hypothetical protein